MDEKTQPTVSSNFTAVTVPDSSLNSTETKIGCDILAQVAAKVDKINVGIHQNPVCSSQQVTATLIDNLLFQMRTEIENLPEKFGIITIGNGKSLIKHSCKINTLVVLHLFLSYLYLASKY